MTAEIFTLVLAGFLAPVLAWGCRRLPGERWQMIAAVPLKKYPDGTWSGCNLTWYGFFSATAYTGAVAVFFVLLGSRGTPAPAIASIAAAVLCLCIPAASVIARVVERKPHVFTVGGAAFAGIIAIPAAVAVLQATVGCKLGWDLHVLPVLAAVCTAYTMGEGLGRLACLSFGCCYGRPLNQTPGWLRRLLSRHFCIFSGATKKIAYAHGLDGTPVVPVQALTAAINCACCCAGCWLFLNGFEHASFLVTLAVSQFWRFFSEFLRADYRGGGTISAYQIMSLAGIAYGILISMLPLESSIARIDVTAGLHLLWSPCSIFGLQGLWVFIFIYTGCSRVTGSTVSFHVKHGNV